MRKESIKLLKDLVDTASPSGFEMRIQDRVRRVFGDVCDKVSTDVCGNVIGVLNPKAKTRVAIMGHCDEIGFLVVHIDEKGFVSFAPIGGIDPGIVTGQRVKLHGAKGQVFGVIGRKDIHMMTPEERGKKPKMHQLWIDIGAKTRKDAEKSIAIGDYVSFDVGFQPMKNDLVAARGFDDRAGAFVVLEAMRRLKSKKLDVAVYGVTTVQEEIGLRGARTSAFGIDPHVGIAIDVGHATDYPGTNAKIFGTCELGKGPTMHRGPNINPVLQKKMEAVAKAKKIPFQITAAARPTGTDANALQINRSGVATALVSVPNRYMHTPVEVISLKDLENTARLVAEVVASLKSGTSFVPKSRR